MEREESEQKYARARAKAEPKLRPADDEIQELRPEEFAKKINKKQQTLEGFVSFTNKAPVAPAPKRGKGTQNLDLIRQKLQQSRSSITGPPKVTSTLHHLDQLVLIRRNHHLRLPRLLLEGHCMQ